MGVVHHVAVEATVAVEVVEAEVTGDNQAAAADQVVSSVAKKATFHENVPREVQTNVSNVAKKATCLVNVPKAVATNASIVTELDISPGNALRKRK